MKKKNIEELEKEDTLLIFTPNLVINILWIQTIVTILNTNQQSSFIPLRTLLEVPDNLLST